MRRQICKRDARINILDTNNSLWSMKDHCVRVLRAGHLEEEVDKAVNAVREI